MHVHTGEHVYRLTNWQRVKLAAFMISVPALCCVILYAALNAHGPAPQPPPAPAPVVVVAA